MVDDHELMREGLKQLFEYVDDIEVGVEAGNGEEVLVILQKERFDLILLDISIPGIHGVELISKIREYPNSPPILILSALASYSATSLFISSMESATDFSRYSVAW